MKLKLLPACLVLLGIGAQAGEKERYVFRVDGKTIGEETAECVSATSGNGAGRSDWKYAVQLSVEAQGQKVSIKMDGTYAVTDTAAPLNLTLNADVNGMAQKVICTFEAGKARSVIDVGGSKFPREAALSGAEFMGANNTLSLWSLVTRALRIEPGQKATISMFFVEALQKISVTFAALPKTETIKVGDVDVECVVCDVAPISNRFYLARDTGALLRLTDDRQKLVIERDK